MMKRLLCLILSLLLCLPALAGAETVVTSFFPIYILTLNLADGIDGLEVHNLAAPTTGCLHDYQLSAADMKALSRADVFLINGAGMESYLQMAMEALPQLTVVDASREIELLPLDDDDDDDEDDHDHHGHDGHDHGEWNAHIWLDAGNAAAMTANLAEGLAAALPQHAQAIAGNRDAFIARLRALDDELRTGLQPAEGCALVTFHEAFPYFAKAYGLKIAAVINREPNDTLSPRSLANLVLTIRELGNPPLFTEPLYGDLAASTVAAETGAPIYSLDPVVTGPAQPPLTYYEDCMRANMAAILQAFQK